MFVYMRHNLVKFLDLKYTAKNKFEKKHKKFKIITKYIRVFF